MPTVKQRVLVALTATIIVAVSGALAGDLFGRFITLKLMERRLLRDVARASTESEIRLTESGFALESMRASSYAPCSDTELTFFRAVIFNAKYMKDAGRMSDGNIDCSASVGRPRIPCRRPSRNLPSSATPMSTPALLSTRRTI